MRASCNGCRALRKGCAEDCTIRPCLAWIRGADAQANATVFLAKFYGRAGLLNLLAAGTDPALRPALFRSLLYEACGRVANPVYGASGLFSTGQWEACQDAVQAVLEGRRIPVRSGAVRHPGFVAAFDVRCHVPRPNAVPAPAHAAGPLALGVSSAGRTMFKRASSSSTAKSKTPSGAMRGEHDGDLDRVPSHGESAGSHDHVEDDGVAVAVAAKQVRGESGDTEAEAASHVSQADQNPPVPPVARDDDEIGLELTLGFGPSTRVLRSPPARLDAASSSSAGCDHIGLLLELPV